MCGAPRPRPPPKLFKVGPRLRRPGLRARPGGPRGPGGGPGGPEGGPGGGGATASKTPASRGPGASHARRSVMSAEQDKEPIALKRVRGNLAGSGGPGECGPTGRPLGRPGPKCAALGARGPHFVCRRAALSIPSYQTPLLLPTTQHNRHLGAKKRHPRTIPTPTPRKLSCTARELRRFEEAPPSKRQHIFAIFFFSLERETRYIQKAFSLLTNKIKNRIIQKSAFCIIGFLLAN